jgi:hypothetical protein
VEQQVVVPQSAKRFYSKVVVPQSAKRFYSKMVKHCALTAGRTNT